MGDGQRPTPIPAGAPKRSGGSTTRSRGADPTSHGVDVAPLRAVAARATAAAAGVTGVVHRRGLGSLRAAKKREEVALDLKTPLGDAAGVGERLGEVDRRRRIPHAAPMQRAQDNRGSAKDNDHVSKVVLDGPKQQFL